MISVLLGVDVPAYTIVQLPEPVLAALRSADGAVDLAAVRAHVARQFREHGHNLPEAEPWRDLWDNAYGLRILRIEHQHPERAVMNEAPDQLAGGSAIDFDAAAAGQLLMATFAELKRLPAAQILERLALILRDAGCTCTHCAVPASPCACQPGMSGIGCRPPSPEFTLASPSAMTLAAATPAA